MWPYPWTHVGTPSHLGHMDRVAATMPSQAHAGAAQEAPDIGQWEGQDVPLVRPSSCNVKGGIPSSRRYLPTYLFLWSGIGTTPHSCLFKFRFQFQVHLNQFFTREGGRQGAESLLIGYQQFLQSGVKVKTLEFLKEILLSMEVALSMFFLFLPISSFGRHRTIVPLRGTLLPIVQRIH